MSLHILIIQLCDAERGDLFDHEFTSRAINFRRIQLYLGDSLPDHSTIRAAVILGSPTSVNEYQHQDWARELYQWTAQALRVNLPLLGICYGSQLVARLLGATVSKHTHMELGIFEAKLTESGVADPLFAHLPKQFTVALWHGDTWKLPFGATLLCEGDDCKNQAFRRGSVIGLQFHLECSENELTRWPAAYPQDVVVAGMVAENLIDSFNAQQMELGRLFGLFLDNWLKEV